MKIVKFIGIGLLGLVLLIVIAGLILPAKVETERSLLINASPEVLFEQVNVLPNWEKWSPWKEMDPESKMTYSTPNAGVGAFYTWEGPETGKGKLTLTEVVPYSRISTQLEFDGQGNSTAAYLFEPQPDGQVKVRWTFNTDMGGNPFMRVFGVVMKSMLNDQFERGLQKLKEVAEAAPKPVKLSWKGRVEAATVLDLPAQYYLAVHDTASVATISNKLGQAYGKIMEAAAKQKLEPSGPPFAIYYSQSNTQFDFDAALPIGKAGKSEGMVMAAQRSARRAVCVAFYGDYSQTPLAHETADAFIRNNNKTTTGPPWEEYVSDPGLEKDTSNWLTKVYYPIR
jgi:effector-binding domain-containing protein